MFLRTQPSSPLATVAYTNVVQTPDSHVSHDPIRTPLKRALHSPARAFPPELGSSSPPMSSPTSYRDHPSFCSDGPSSSRSTTSATRNHQSSAGMFAARARALQPPLQRSSSLIHGSVVSGSSGSSGFAQADSQQHLRYGPRPGMRKAMTGGAAGDPVSSSHSSKSTGYSLFYKPTLQDRGVQDRTHARPSRSQPPSSSALLPPMNLSTTAADQSIQGSMWKGRFRQRCLAVSRKREEKDRMSRTADRVNDGFRGPGSEGDPMEEQVESDIEAEAEHEEIFRRMIQKEHRRAAHRMAVSFEQEVGGSDPAVWEAELLEAEGMSVEAETTSATCAPGLPPQLPAQGRSQGSTPAKAVASQWQYRSATKRPLYGTLHTGSAATAGGGALCADAGSTHALLPNNSLVEGYDDDEDDQQTWEQVEQYARFLQAQEDEDHLVAEYAAQVMGAGAGAGAGAGGAWGQGTVVDPTRPLALEASSSAGRAEAEGAADTPGAELNIEMQGFTWEDAPLSDDDVVGGQGRGLGQGQGKGPLRVQPQEDVDMV